MLRLILKKEETFSFLRKFRSFTCSAGSAINGSSSFSIMSFGDGSQGALGLPSSIVGIQGDVYEATRLPGLPSDLVGVSAGQYHSLAVTNQGELWAWGRNEEGQLGRGLLAPRDSWNEPQRVAELDKVRVKAAFASGVVSSALGDDGSLWVWGRSKRGQLGLGEGITEAIAPARVNALAGQEVLKVSFGWGHALALTTDGKLYGWGYSADGRLGQLGTSSSPLDAVRRADGNPAELIDIAAKIVQESIEKEDSMPIIWEPCLVEEFKSVEVIDVACGLDHSLVLCRDGTVLSGGSNTYNQLGRGAEDIGFLPVQMPFTPISLASGLGHSMSICRYPSSSDEEDTTRKVVSWGWNGNSQLGRGGPPNMPCEVEGLEGEKPVSVSGGRVHSLAVTVKGELWVWGCGKNGRLGLGSSFDEPEPFLVDMEGCKVVQAVAGFDHSLLLVSDS